MDQEVAPRAIHPDGNDLYRPGQSFKLIGLLLGRCESISGGWPIDNNCEAIVHANGFQKLLHDDLGCYFGDLLD